MPSMHAIVIAAVAAAAAGAPVVDTSTAAFSQVTSVLESIYAAAPTNAVLQAAALLSDGISGSSTVEGLLAGYSCDTFNNSNPRDPALPIYPSKAATDAPYDIAETTLRAAIRIPQDFQYGVGATPLIFVPGTGVTGCETYTPTYARVLANATLADPVFLNVPTRMLDDEQNNAEFIAYAINYISGISNGANVSIMAYSGGNTAAQWALKYWPSTRRVVSHYIALSPDYHGTTLEFTLCAPDTPCAPAVLQQRYLSTFLQTLLNNGGDSAYVPTTASWSIFDENVEPQQGNNASAMLQDAHGAGFLGNQIQQTCGPATPAGAPVPGHEGTLYNIEAMTVSLDALQHQGPGSLLRSQAAQTCGQLVRSDLGVMAITGTEALQVIAATEINTYPHKVVQEPSIKPYARKDMPSA